MTGQRATAAAGGRILVVADGDSEPAQLARAAVGADRVIAADGGALRALAAGVRPHLVIGDGDSLGDADRARLAAQDIVVRTVARDKDESDTELCLLAAMAEGATGITVVGAMGGPRPEHAVANLLLLADARLDAVAVEIVAGATSYRRVGTVAGTGRVSLTGERGDWVSLLALAGDVDGVSTTGLRFGLDGERLSAGPARGLSNELVETQATVSTKRGRLLVIHTARSPEERNA